MRTIAKYALPVLGALAAVAIAAPAQAKQPDGVQDRAATDVTNEDASAACVYGVPASSSVETYAAVAALGTSRSYDVDEGFASTHAVGSAMNLYMSPGSAPDDYASFKCQYACNGTPGCVSFFGRFVHVNSTTAHFECLTFGALLDEGAFTSESKNIANGGFNKLCD